MAFISTTCPSILKRFPKRNTEPLSKYAARLRTQGFNAEYVRSPLGRKHDMLRVEPATNSDDAIEAALDAFIGDNPILKSPLAF